MKYRGQTERKVFSSRHLLYLPQESTVQQEGNSLWTNQLTQVWLSRDTFLALLRSLTVLSSDSRHLLKHNQL